MRSEILSFPAPERIVAGALLAALVLAGSVPGAGPPELELLDRAELPPGTTFDGTCVGGLSAVAYDVSADRYFVVSDSGHDARLYTVDLPIVAGDGGAGRGVQFGPVTVERLARLRTREGEPYPPDRIDPEGLALVDARTGFLSSEGKPDLGVPPFVDLIDLRSGAHLAAVAVPPAFTPRREGDRQVAGVRFNAGFEALALERRGELEHLHTASESPLVQDFPETGAAAGTEMFSRWLHYRRSGLGTYDLVARYRYPLRLPAGDVVAHGLVELLALGHRRFLALERTYARDRGLTVRLYTLRLPRVRQGRSHPPILRKTLLLDFAEGGVVLENYEGLTLGPRLPDGSESLIVVGDNDDTTCAPPAGPAAGRPTRFLLFRLRR